MKSLSISAAAVVLALGSSVTAASAETERISRTVRIDPGGTLVLKGFAGRVTITGSDRSDISIEATRYGSREELDRNKLEIETDRSRVRIIDTRDDRDSRRGRYRDGDRDRDRGLETDFDIKVPRKINLDVDLFSASLDASGIDGDHVVHTFSSRARLEDVDGSIRATSFSGSFDLRPKTWRDRERIDVETFSGRVEIRLPESARGSIDFESFSGRLDSSLPITLGVANRRRITGSIGASGAGDGSLRVKTFSGSVTVNR
jgi:DUF4097 and DUF4098 domain-containing protein YvlB